MIFESDIWRRVGGGAIISRGERYTWNLAVAPLKVVYGCNNTKKHQKIGLQKFQNGATWQILKCVILPCKYANFSDFGSFFHSFGPKNQFYGI